LRLNAILNVLIHTTYIRSTGTHHVADVGVQLRNQVSGVPQYIFFVPSLYKIFDEIAVNATDNKHSDKKINEMLITIDSEAGEISM
jgi:hypothetical protein